MRVWTRDRGRRPWASDTEGVYLERDGWNDFGFTTMWTLFVVWDGKLHEIGGVKIARPDGESLRSGQRYDRFPEEYFSLGQDAEYYERLNDLGASIRREVLSTLNDLALDLDRFRKVQGDEVVQNSFLRWISPSTVMGQLHRMALGGLTLSPYSFEYESPTRDRNKRATVPRVMTFDVDPEAVPGTSIHVLTGRNGVGKSFILNDIATAITLQRSAGEVRFAKQPDSTHARRFANVVSVAFSAFDAFEPRRPSSSPDAIRHHYIGLKKISSSSEKSSGLKDHRQLASEFGTSLKACVEKRLLDRWRTVLDFLSSDPLFADVLKSLSPSNDDVDLVREEARTIFGELSSGHKIVLLTLTRLVETVEEATLVLIDEPESHLHPPLLSAFMSALSELLQDRNGVAIIATHSPVVLQEVPRRCVWKLHGEFGVLVAERPTIETYGENVGTLTQEVFGLEVAASGFHRAIADTVKANPTASYSEIERIFDSALGAEARALVQLMTFSRRK